MTVGLPRDELSPYEIIMVLAAMDSDESARSSSSSTSVTFALVDLSLNDSAPFAECHAGVRGEQRWCCATKEASPRIEDLARRRWSGDLGLALMVDPPASPAPPSRARHSLAAMIDA